MSDYRRYCTAIDGERLPVAIVDLDALESNIDAVAVLVRATGKKLRVATKSLRCPALIDVVLERLGALSSGLMSYAVSEAALLVARGHTDVLVAYPTVQPEDLRSLAALNREPDVRASVVVDAREHIAAIAAAARAADTEIPVVVDVDMSLHALGDQVHLGVRRSPLRTAAHVVAMAEAARAEPGVRFCGVMGYEAQVAGMGEANPFSRAMNPIRAAIKRASMPLVRQRRRAVAEALAARGFDLEIFNGGGTGSLSHNRASEVVTELTAGSGFLCSHLFDYYPDLDLRPAAFFALQVVRTPRVGFATCHGGGFVASGEAGLDRLPRPWLPAGLTLTRFEGAGEVQTPLSGPAAASLRIGDPVFFRHAKAGELAEHVNEYLLVRGDEIESRAPTYRGLGHVFL